MSLACSSRPVVALCALLLLPAAHAQRWEMQYFYDEDKSTLAISDLTFPTAQRGVAVGHIEEEDGRTRGRAVVTSDGGARWSLVPLPDPGLSVFFLNDTLGWAVTTGGIYRSEEGGRSWRKLPKSPRGTLRVWFVSPEHGFAVGLRKSVHQTLDGGKSWQPLPAAAEIKTAAEHTAFHFITFTGQVGYICGAHQPPRRDESELPDWLEPEKAVRRKEWPTTAILLATEDGGKSWKPSTSSIFGQITRLRQSRDGRAISLVEYRHSFQYPSEVYAIDRGTSGSRSVYKAKDRAVTDAVLIPSGPLYLAATAVSGRLQRSPIPSALHILRSDDMETWSEMEVDYRATARRAVLAAAEGNVWVATDTGMILKLVE